MVEWILRTAFGRLTTVADLSIVVEFPEDHQLGVLRTAFETQLTAAFPPTSAPAAPLAAIQPTDSSSFVDTTTDATLARGSAFTGARDKQKNKKVKGNKKGPTLKYKKEAEELCANWNYRHCGEGAKKVNRDGTPCTRRHACKFCLEDDHRLKDCADYKTAQRALP